MADDGDDDAGIQPSTDAWECRPHRSPPRGSWRWTVLPAAATATANPWQVTEPWVQTVLTGIKTSSWILAALFLAGITGLLRNRTT